MSRALRVIKAIYDVLASYLLAWVFYFALVAALLHLLLALLLVRGFGFDSVSGFWRWAGQYLPLPKPTFRLAAFALAHVLIYLRVRVPLGRLRNGVEHHADRWIRRHRRWARRHPRSHLGLEIAFSCSITLLLFPFVVQPTLVPLRWNTHHWVRRAANLADGSASIALVESVVGLYRRLVARPVIGPGINDRQFESSFGNQSTAGPSMKRWDPLIWDAVKGDAEAFALVKAVLWVESGGRQYAVSSTGCVGLMQFCSQTARNSTFRQIFGIGQVYPCRCEGPCQVPRPLQRELESGDGGRVSACRELFVCELSDARFDPTKSIAAGWRYLRALQQQLGNNLYLTYVGYNSGPRVAERLYAALGHDNHADLRRLGLHLHAALRPHYGHTAPARAKALLAVHLPKLRRAYDDYVQLATQRTSAAALVPHTYSSGNSCFDCRATYAARH